MSCTSSATSGLTRSRWRAASRVTGDADPDAPVQVTAEVVYAHSLGEVVNAAIAAGLRIDALHEQLETDLDARGNVLTRGEDGRYRLEVSSERLPVLFTLIATRRTT
jgi:hypothetical protein